MDKWLQSSMPATFSLVGLGSSDTRTEVDGVQYRLSAELESDLITVRAAEH